MLQYSDILYKRREVWKSKEILRRLYHKWYGIIGNAINPGTIMEIGGGSGNLKEFFPDAISSDILFVSWLDVVADAHHLPFKEGGIDNIVLFDVLHHLWRPVSFFSDAARVLKQGGRILIMEPYVSWTSSLVYRFIHSEGMDRNIDPFQIDCSVKGESPFSGNQSITTLIFEKYKERFIAACPHFRIIRQERSDFILYPLSGGFNNPSLCPMFLYNLFDRLEKILKPLSRFLAFRIFVVLERT
jgi:SAM-dependent methyltransferase